jgi:hypothetical protein
LFWAGEKRGEIYQDDHDAVKVEQTFEYAGPQSGKESCN